MSSWVREIVVGDLRSISLEDFVKSGPRELIGNLRIDVVVCVSVTMVKIDTCAKNGFRQAFRTG